MPIIPNTQRLRQEDHKYDAFLGYIVATPCPQIKKNNLKVCECGSVVEHLPSLLKAIGSIPNNNPPQKKKEKNDTLEEVERNF
jgi:hypothetical protein